MAKKVTTTAAKADLLQLIDEVLQSRQRFVITRRGKAVAALVPASDVDQVEGESMQRDSLEARKVITRVKSGKEKTSLLATVVDRLKS